MVATYADSLLSTSGLSDDASFDMPLDDTAAMPDGSDDAALADGDSSVDAATETDDAPLFDFDSLTPEQRDYIEAHYRTQYESQFKADKDRLNAEAGNKVRQWRQQAEQAQAQVNALAAGLQAKDAWVQRFLAERGDELDFYKYRDQTGAAPQQVMQQQTAARQQAGAFVQTQVAKHQAEIQRLSLDEQGQQLFDPADPDIDVAFQTFLEASYNDQLSGGLNPQLNAAAVSAWEGLRSLMHRKQLEGTRRVAQAAAQAGRANKARESQRAIEARKARGAQATGNGNRTAATVKPLDEQAWERFPEPHQQAERLQFIQERAAR